MQISGRTSGKGMETVERLVHVISQSLFANWCSKNEVSLSLPSHSDRKMWVLFSVAFFFFFTILY